MNRFKQYLESVQEEKYQYNEISFAKKIATKTKRLFDKKINREERKNIVSDLKTIKTFIPNEKDLSSKDEVEKDDNQNKLFDIQKSIKKKYKGTILYLHGFPDNPSQNITDQLEAEGFRVINQKIMWGKAFKENKQALMNVLARKAKKSNLIIGSSFGGYIAFLLTGMTKTPCLLINPAISIHTIKAKSGPEHADPNLYFYDKSDKQEYDNNVTKINSHFVDNDIYKKILKNYPSGNEIFFGGGDTLLPPEKTKQTLKRLGISNKFKTFTIKNMGHGHIQSVRHDEPGLFKDMKPIDLEWGAHDYFSRILNQSNILKKLIK